MFAIENNFLLQTAWFGTSLITSIFWFSFKLELQKVPQLVYSAPHHHFFFSILTQHYVSMLTISVCFFRLSSLNWRSWLITSTCWRRRPRIRVRGCSTQIARCSFIRLVTISTHGWTISRNKSKATIRDPTWHLLTFSCRNNR